MKKCSKCENVKSLEKFSRDKHSKDGRKTICKQCDIKRQSIYKRTKKGLISQIYRAQIQHSKTRGHHIPKYTIDELIDWLYENNFDYLYNTWVSSGYKKELIPSIDRINPDKGYFFGNIQLITWKENDKKGTMERCGGIKKVAQYSKDGELISVFKSAYKAQDVLNINQGNISRCCNGKLKTAGGYIWKFA